MDEPVYPYVHVDVNAEMAEDVSVRLFELGATGIEERDSTTLIHGAAGGTTLVASFPSQAEAEGAVAELDSTWSPRVEVVVGDAWRDEWKKYFHAFAIFPGMVIAPSWESCTARPDETVIRLDPGRAFGTGLHETTSLAAAAMDRHRGAVSGALVLDLGCGSGILSLIAVHLGAAHVYGYDSDPEAVIVATANAEYNDQASRITLTLGDAATVSEAFPVVVANIDASVLLPYADPIGRSVSSHGLLILSGLLSSQMESIRAAYPAFQLIDTLTNGEWQAVVLRGPRQAV